MSVYPPLRPEQILTISRHVACIMDAVNDILNIRPKMPTTESEVDELIAQIADFRRRVSFLDHLLFQTWGLVHRLRDSNVPTSLPPARPKPQLVSLDDLESL